MILLSHWGAMNYSIKPSHLIFAGIAMVFYMNCSDYKKTEDSLGSQSCPAGKLNALEELNFIAENDCMDPSLIQCEQRVFSPNIENSQFNVEQCIDHVSLGTVCTEVTLRNYDTSSAQGSREDFAEGGPYNYQEVNCYYKKFTYNDRAIFSASSASLQESLSTLHQLCMNGGEK